MLAVSAASFTLFQLAPGDFFTEMRLNPQISNDVVNQLRQKYGLDQPVFQRYRAWLCSLSHGDLGFSFAYGAPVRALLLARVPNTLLLTSIATAIAWGLAIPLGTVSAASPQSVLARVVSAGTVTLLVTPELLLALACLVIGVRTGWSRLALTTSSYDASPWQGLRESSTRLLMPTLALVLGSLPALVRHVASAMHEALASPCIVAARAHGIARRRLLYRHALPVALNPLISLFGTSLGSLLSASLVVEVVMGWPGIGPLLLEAIMNRDIYVVIGVVMLSSCLVVCGAFAADVLLFAVDPRIRVERLA
jgi:peptide/nickel transport system permease protein